MLDTLDEKRCGCISGVANDVRLSGRRERVAAQENDYLVGPARTGKRPLLGALGRAAADARHRVPVITARNSCSPLASGPLGCGMMP